MKRKTENITTVTAGRSVRRLPLAACAALLALAACTAGDDTPPADGNAATPVAFTAGIASATLPASQSAAPAPGTRTGIRPDDGQTVWTQGDAVGIFMLSAGGALPDGILAGADNRKHTVDPATGALSPDGTPIYYPQAAAVDFIALYPYSDKGEGEGKITADYRYALSVADQSRPATIDVLYAKATGRERSATAVGLDFRHVLSLIKLDIKPGDGLDGLTADQITAVTLAGMPASATLALQDGTLTPGAPADIAARKEARPSPGATATFAALVPPQEAGAYTRSIVVTADGATYTGTIPAAHDYAGNEMCTYPVTLRRTGVDVGTPAIAPWTENGHGGGTAGYIHTVTFDANGGAGTVPAPQEAPDGESTRLPDASGLTPPAAGKTFIGWSTSTTPHFSNDFYQAGYYFRPQSNTTLYAVWNGDGSSEENPTLIFDPDGLDAMRNNLAGHYRLMTDVAVSAWVPVGTDASPFTGTFNGQGRIVTIHSFADNLYHYGLFGKGNGCKIRQVCVAVNIEYRDTDFETGGGILGEAKNGCVIENCLVTADINVDSTDPTLGGILGRVNAESDALVIVKNCLVRGKLAASGPGGYIGGIVGIGSRSQTVNCVVLSESINGNWLRSGGTYRIGSLNSGQHNYGNRAMTGKNWASDASGRDGAHCDPKPTPDWWKNRDNWKNDGDFAAWDFTNIWEMGHDGYPCLRRIGQP